MAHLRVTPDLLDAAGACSDFVQNYRDQYPDGVDAVPDNATLFRDGLGFDPIWAVRLLSQAGQETFNQWCVGRIANLVDDLGAVDVSLATVAAQPASYAADKDKTPMMVAEATRATLAVKASLDRKDPGSAAQTEWLAQIDKLGELLDLEAEDE